MGKYYIYAYCSNNYINAVDSNGMSLLAAIGVKMITGGLVGLASQALADVATSIITGKPQISSVGSYIGAFVGGAVGGVIPNPLAASMVSGALGSVIGNAYDEMLTGKEISIEKYIRDALVDTSTSIISDQLATIALPSIKKINSKRNSYSSVYKSGVTKLKNNTAKKISAKVVLKGTISDTVSDAYSIPMSHISNETKAYLDEQYESLQKKIVFHQLSTWDPVSYFK